jgi:RNA polymerase sigma-70 factor (ECF subfamily)
MNAGLDASLRQAFRQQERFLWGLCYRMTGSAADAEDLVQDTFVRAMERPPRRLDDPLRPWLVKVAMNLSRDHLRRRRRAPYRGPWLPGPVETPLEEEPPGHEPEALAGHVSTESRYDLLESVSLAFLLALEALTPAQRAVLLLRGVFDYSVRETADALAMSEPNVKTTHHRARRAMSAYDARRPRSPAAIADRHRRALERFMASLAAQDVAAIEAMLADGVTAISDGGGVYYAAGRPLVDRAQIIRFYTKVATQRLPLRSTEIRVLNGLPAALIEFGDEPPGQAPRFVMTVEVDEDGRIERILAILAPRKLAGIRGWGEPEPGVAAQKSPRLRT